MSALKQTGELPVEFAGAPELPDETEYLWEWFMQLHAARGSTGFGPSPISYQDLAAWAALTRRQPEPWEIAMIKNLDVTYLNFLAEAKKK